MVVEQLPRSTEVDTVRRVARWIVLLAMTVWGLFAGAFLAYHSLAEGFIVESNLPP